jgi:hypothetical protein
MLLIIRGAQMAALDAAVLDGFIRRMVAHLRTILPERIAAWGDPDTKARVTDAIERASAFGLAAERDVARYVDLAVAFGADFPDRDDMVWARDILNDDGASAATRVRRLYDELERRFPDHSALWTAWR